MPDILRALVAISIAAAAGCATGGSPVMVSKGLAVVDVTVIDMTGAPPQAHMTVVVEGDRIVEIAPTEKVALGPHVQRLDGTSKFLIPGLWDMHAHVAEHASIWLPVMLANGITGVRNMHATSLELTNQVKADLESGTLTGPRFVANGPLIDGPNSVWRSAVSAGTPSEGIAAVNHLAGNGADFIKVYSFLPRPTYFAIAAEANAIGIPFGGHVPEVVSALEASVAGQRSIEHLDGVLLASSSIEHELRERFRTAGAAWRTPATAAEGQVMMGEVNVELVREYDPDKAKALFATFAANGTMQVPTLVTHYTNAYRDQADIDQSPRFRFVPASLLARWKQLPPPDPGWMAGARQLLSHYQTVVHDMQTSGVVILAGTDVGGALIVPGHSLHRELALLVEAGLTPMEALQAATRNAAIYFDELDSAGTIEPGKVADFVLLDADPLTDIVNTRRVNAVVVSGRYFGRNALNQMLARAEADAAAR